MTNINYQDKNQKTLSINFDTVEQRQQFKQIAESLEWNDRELGKQLILDFMTKLNNQKFLKSNKALSFWVSEEEELAAMASDPEIQAEIAAMNKEFAVTEMDGLENLRQ